MARVSKSRGKRRRVVMTDVLGRASTVFAATLGSVGLGPAGAHLLGLTSLHPAALTDAVAPLLDGRRD